MRRVNEQWTHHIWRIHRVTISLVPSLTGPPHDRFEPLPKKWLARQRRDINCTTCPERTQRKDNNECESLWSMLCWVIFPGVWFHSEYCSLSDYITVTPVLRSLRQPHFTPSVHRIVSCLFCMWPCNRHSYKLSVLLCLLILLAFIIIALCNRADHYIFMLWFVLSFFLHSFFLA